MGSGNGKAPRSLAQTADLAKEPHHFDFFQAVRLLECAHPEKPKIGHSCRAADDPVQLGQDPHLRFAPATLSSFAFAPNGSPRLGSYFFGLLGPQGPLPIHLTEFAYFRKHNAGDPVFSRFLDLFHHRMLSLFYRAWADARPTVQYDRPEQDRFGFYVGALTGRGLDALQNRDAIADTVKSFFAGRFSHGPRNAEGLQAILAEYFRIPARLQEFVGSWLKLSESDRCHLAPDSPSSVLGQTALLGERVFGHQHSFRLVLGPLSFEDYERFFPGRPGLTHLIDLVRNYLGDELQWDLKLILKKEAIPETRLGVNGRLGYCGWLKKEQPFSRDAELQVSSGALAGTAGVA